MTYKETCEYLYSQMPMFEKQGASGYKEGLSNTLALDEHFEHPHRSYACIHIGGTNGKGSVSHTLAAILQTSGLRVGLYTSPHLVDFCERIRVNGTPISEEYVVDFVEKERHFFEPLYPSFFEVTTALAFKYFRDMKVDIAVIEVGLGGRLDCTNIITPLVSVITNISYDHTQFLGNTLDQIATEKAGIIKRGVPAVIGESDAETRPVFESRAKEMNAPIIFAEDSPEVVHAETTLEGGMHYTTLQWGDLDGDLGGIYQQKNLNTVLHVLQCLKQNNNLFPQQLSIAVVREAIKSVSEITGLMGRWQTIQHHPTVVCDTGHNVGGWQYISRQLKRMTCQKLHIVFGMVNDKDVNGVLELLPKHAIYYFTQAESKRAINSSTLQAIASEYNLTGNCYPSVFEAYKAAIEAAEQADFVFIGGSSYVVGDFLRTCF